MSKEPFSKRHGFRGVREAKIVVRHDAPYEFRGAIVQIAYECGFGPAHLRSAVCNLLRKRPDPNNWSPYPNIDEEVRNLIDECEWYRVYDIVERIFLELEKSRYSLNPEEFETEINSYFYENGVGWQLRDGLIEIRGSEVFEDFIKKADESLEENGFETARNELREALTDLSRRPEPDNSGAIQHSMAALECVARAVTEDEKASLGEILKRNSTLIPKPLV